MTESKHILCKEFFTVGVCYRGAGCPYYHTTDAVGVANVRELQHLIAAESASTSSSDSRSQVTNGHVTSLNAPQTTASALGDSERAELERLLQVVAAAASFQHANHTPASSTRPPTTHHLSYIAPASTSTTVNNATTTLGSAAPRKKSVHETPLNRMLGAGGARVTVPRAPRPVPAPSVVTKIRTGTSGVTVAATDSKATTAQGDSEKSTLAAPARASNSIIPNAMKSLKRPTPDPAPKEAQKKARPLLLADAKIDASGNAGSHTADRPRIALVSDPKIPAVLRQRYLDAFYDVYVTRDPATAANAAVQAEQGVFDKSATKQVYVGVAVSALRTLRTWKPRTLD